MSRNHHVSIKPQHDVRQIDKTTRTQGADGGLGLWQAKVVRGGLYRQHRPDERPLGWNWCCHVEGARPEKTRKGQRNLCLSKGGATGVCEEVL